LAFSLSAFNAVAGEVRWKLVSRGYYLQPGVSGVHADYLFWRQRKTYGAASRVPSE